MHNKKILDKVTMIIPTHERHPFLKRVLDYYSDAPFKIIICDSSKLPFLDFSQSENMEYIHTPEVGFVSKISAITGKLVTPYSLMCADDDFISISGIEKSIYFLEKNNDYSSAGGRYVDFNIICNEVYCVEGYSYAQYCDISSDDVSERLKQVFNPYFPFFYSVHKTATIKKSFPLFDNTMRYKNLRLMEISFIMVSVIEGKHKTLPFFYAARENDNCDENEGTRAMPHLHEVWEENSYFEEKKTFLIMMINHIMNEMNMSKNEAKQAIENSVNTYITNSLKGHNNNKIVSKIKKYIPNFVRTLLKVYRSSCFSVKLFKKLHTKYPFNNEVSLPIWLEIEKYIVKYNEEIKRK